MRDQFYADRKDVWKWTVTLREAKHVNARRVLYVAMMTSDERQSDEGCSAGYGGNFEHVPGANPAVAAFFEAERRCFMPEPAQGIVYPHNRRVRRITRMDAGYGAEILYVGAEYRAKTASAYFRKQVVPMLRVRDEAAESPIVVLLDPDNGLAQADLPKDHQIGGDGLIDVWKAMRPRDVLVVFVEPCHAENAMQKEADRVSALLGGVAVAQVPFPFSKSKGFLVADKT